MAFSGPYVGYNVSGSMASGNNTIELSKDELSEIDYGAELGIGFRIPTFSMDGRSNLNIKASYFRGFANSFPADLSKYSAEEMSSYYLSSQGSRVNQGFKLTLSYDLSMEKKKVTTFTAGGDGKRTYKRFVNIK